MRTVKREVLRLIETFVERCEDPHLVAQQLVPAMMDPVLADYARNVPDARDAEVLSLFAAIINKVESAMMEEVPKIFEAVFECTLQMITVNFEDYPDHRLKFFSLLRAITNHCFRALFALAPAQLKLVVDSIVWAFRHTERNIAETGLNLLLEMTKYFQVSEFCNQFHQSFYLSLIQEIFAVMTDGFHKPGFKIHALILQNLFCIAESEQLSAPLWDVAAAGPAGYPNNASFVKEHVSKLLTSSFPNMGRAEAVVLVQGMFDYKADLTMFKNHLRDFLVQTKQFKSSDNSAMFAEEQAARQTQERARIEAIPGMLPPSQIDMGDD
jgi:exportin-1